MNARDSELDRLLLRNAELRRRSVELQEEMRAQEARMKELRVGIWAKLDPEHEPLPAVEINRASDS